MVLPLPTIGINTSLESRPSGDMTYIKPDYWQAILAAGGLPVLMPQLDDPALIDAFLDRVDGFVMIGGGDISAQRLNVKTVPNSQPIHPRRERTDFLLLERLLARAVPTLAICLGCQELNVLRGGSLSLDLPNHAKLADGSDARHGLTIAGGSRLRAILGATELPEINSSHHQAVSELGQGLLASAHAPDGVIEAIEVAGLPFFLGVQWHPERLSADSVSRKLFAALLDRALKSK